MTNRIGSEDSPPSWCACLARALTEALCSGAGFFHSSASHLDSIDAQGENLEVAIARCCARDAGGCARSEGKARHAAPGEPQGDLGEPSGQTETRRPEVEEGSRSNCAASSRNATSVSSRRAPSSTRGRWGAIERTTPRREGDATNAAKAKAQAATLEVLSAGRDELRQHARRLQIPGRSAMNTAELRSAIVKTAKKTGAKLGAGMIVAPLAAAAVAFDATKSKASAAGVTEQDATLGRQGRAVAGVTTAVVTGLIAKMGPKFFGRAVPGVGLALMAEGAREGLQKHGPAGAFFGAFGLDDVAAIAKHKVEEVLLPPPSKRHEAIVPRSSRFATANAAYHAMQTAKQTSGNTLKGTQNPTNQAAIQANRLQRTR